MIEVVAGKPRGIRLIDRAEELSEVDVLLRLVADGWKIADGDKTIVAPPGRPHRSAEGPAGAVDKNGTIRAARARPCSRP
jgi:hypothetical protein